MKMTLNIKQNLKFFIVGGLGMIFNYIVYKGFLFFNYPNDIAWVIGILFASQSNYIINAKWTFKEG
jgi:putative flippase GtrA